MSGMQNIGPGSSSSRYRPAGHAQQASSSSGTRREASASASTSAATAAGRKPDAARDLADMKTHAQNLRSNLQQRRAISDEDLANDKRFLPYMVREMNERKDGINLHYCEGTRAAVKKAHSFVDEAKLTGAPVPVRCVMGEDNNSHFTALDMRAHPNGQVTIVRMDPAAHTDMKYGELSKDKRGLVAGSLSYGSYAQASQVDCPIYSLYNTGLFHENRAQFDRAHESLMRRSRGEADDNPPVPMQMVTNASHPHHYIVPNSEGRDPSTNPTFHDLVPDKLMKHAQSTRTAGMFQSQTGRSPEPFTQKKSGENETREQRNRRLADESPDIQPPADTTRMQPSQRRAAQEFENSKSIGVKRIVYMERTIDQMERLGPDGMALPAEAPAKKTSFFGKLFS